MIESSFAMQYPAKDLYAIGDDDMEWIEFVTLLSGIMPKTPLGNIISIRSEEDEEVLKNFTQEQHRIRNEWRSLQIGETIRTINKEEAMQRIKAMFKSMGS